MSDRISYSEEEQFPGQFFLWRANSARSLLGKAGQAALRELRDALLALPTKRLVVGVLDNGADCCAIGALVRRKGITPKADPEYEMEDVGVECGMPRLVAWRVVEENDMATYSMTPEQRYAAILAWVNALLGRNKEVAHS